MSMPKAKVPPPPPPPPNTPTQADASVFAAGRAAMKSGYTSMIDTAPQGLTRKANTIKTSLIGGN